MKVAILDLYNNKPNFGLGSIVDTVSSFPELEYKIFNVRAECELPDLEYDIYISTGGPGNPLAGDGKWDRDYLAFIDRLWVYNLTAENPKHAFFICHSFQMLTHHFGLGRVTRRKRKSFGIYPVYLTDEGEQDPLLGKLPNPFYAGDFRDYQFIQPDMNAFENLGGKILALEKIRPHIKLERAVMAIRLSPTWVGVQFHPEAEPQGMLEHFEDPERRAFILEQKGLEKFEEMLSFLNDPEKLRRTHGWILPQFLKQAIERNSLVISG